MCVYTYTPKHILIFLSIHLLISPCPSMYLSSIYIFTYAYIPTHTYPYPPT